MTHQEFSLIILVLVWALYGGWDARNQGLSKKQWKWFLVGTVLSGSLCGRLLMIFYQIENYREQPLLALQFWKGSFSYIGLAIGTIIFFFAYTAWNKIPRWRMFDLLARGTALNEGLHGLGDYFLGFDNHLFALWRCLASLGIFAGLFWLRRRVTFEGQSGLVFTLLFFSVRLAVRPNVESQAMLPGGFTLGQLVSCVAVLLAILVGLFKYRQATRDAASANQIS